MESENSQPSLCRVGFFAAKDSDKRKLAIDKTAQMGAPRMIAIGK